MQAFIEHRGRYGILGFRPRFTLYLQIEFSTEECAIIRTRALQNYVFDLSPGYLATTESRHSPETLGIYQLGAIGLFLVGVIFMFVAAAVSIFSVPTILCLAGGPILWWYTQHAKRREDDAYVSKISIGYLLANPSISVQADNPANAPIIEENIRKRLAALKDFLTTTHELSTPRSFEL